MKPQKSTRMVGDGIRARSTWPSTTTIPSPTTAIRVTPEYIHKYLRKLGITEHVLIHEQDLNQFLEEKGLTELGRGGEGTVYFTRGHVVKVINPECAHGSLREIAHMLHLNRIADSKSTMGERQRLDWPTLLWVYVLSDGSLSIGMRPFDTIESATPGATLFDRIYVGPRIPRSQVLQIIRGICHSLVYAHRCGIIHHDLKPANIYIPGSEDQPPVVFDLGQALWQHNSWGRGWLRHEHNMYHWYNGTYRYMHHQRRLSHLAALAKSEQKTPSPEQQAAFSAYSPSFYDDVIAFARILRDIVKSQQACLNNRDRASLMALYQRIMGLKRKRVPAAKHELVGAKKEMNHSDSGLIRRIGLALLRPTPHPAPAPEAPRYMSMEQTQPEIDKLLDVMSVG